MYIILLDIYVKKNCSLDTYESKIINQNIRKNRIT